MSPCAVTSLSEVPEIEEEPIEIEIDSVGIILSETPDISDEEDTKVPVAGFILSTFPDTEDSPVTIPPDTLIVLSAVPEAAEGCAERVCVTPPSSTSLSAMPEITEEAEVSVPEEVECLSLEEDTSED